MAAGKKAIGPGRRKSIAVVVVGLVALVLALALAGAGERAADATGREGATGRDGATGREGATGVAGPGPVGAEPSSGVVEPSDGPAPGSAGGAAASGLPGVPPWAPAASAAIRPGVRTTTRGGGVCTAGFVFTAADRVYLGQAAHCGGTGSDTDTDGCRSGTVPLGAPVVIAGADGRSHTGRLAYSSWVAMQADGETDPETCADDDFALVALDPADAGEVNPSVPFFGGPTGLDTAGLRAGEPVYGYGSRSSRPGAGRRGQQAGPHVGTSAADDRGAPVHEIYSIRPWVAGDSGSGILASDGAAVGQLVTLHLAPLPVSAGVTDLAQALDHVDAVGGLGDVELAMGTEPFDPAPPGVALTELATPAGPPLRP